MQHGVALGVNDAFEGCVAHLEVGLGGEAETSRLATATVQDLRKSFTLHIIVPSNELNAQYRKALCTDIEFFF